jgi:mitochondrial chaperone BCS1
VTFILLGPKYSNEISFSQNEWRHVASRPKRPLCSIVLDPGIKDLLIDDAREFLESKTWYNERGIPFRRGYLLVRLSTLSVTASL